MRNRQLAEEWTYRFLAAARHWADTEAAVATHITPLAAGGDTDLDHAPPAPEPSTAEVRAWARASGIPVPGRGKLGPASGTPGETPTAARLTRIRNKAAATLGGQHRLAGHRTSDTDSRDQR